eukprot:CAMPEP_0182437796 /NCGR_PEP_ID=MMETSP1167-20130531/85290_1 /TAXON_ID=2988 /ORGANISM="Mallomonas Sp, Strain CCMP3275" /LENGTH=233 /DNA_ID=CAMNT_0024630845 /DNA_START=639 /DNA_END=1337 /DNA_ORIENTATION=-
MPNATHSMEDLKIYLELLRSNVSFGFAHFNDGEIFSIADTSDGQETDWGWQNCSKEMSIAMFNALTNTAPNFYIGIPCLCEFKGKFFFKALEYLNVSHVGLNTPPLEPEKCPTKPAVLKFPDESYHPYLSKRLTVATPFINGNYHYAKTKLKGVLNEITQQGRRVHVVCGEGHSPSGIGFPVKSTVFAKKRHAFNSDYSRMRTLNFTYSQGYAAGDVVLIMLGPLGRILASEW